MTGEREQRVVDGVGGEDHHRPLGREAALDQSGRESIDQWTRGRIGQFVPVGALALGQEDARGVALDRGAEKPCQARIVRGQGVARAAAQRAIGAALAGDVRGRIGDGA